VSEPALIELEGIQKSYLGREPIFSNINLRINKGEFLFLTGVSGAGKSTIFRMLLGIESPDLGKVVFDQKEVTNIPKDKMYLHRRKIGMVFQDYKLLENKTAEENIAIPLQILRFSASKKDRFIKDIAAKLNIERLLDQPVKSLSGGEQQLIAIGRAAVHTPDVILADEPTANLDQKMATRIIRMLELLNSIGITVIIATHDINLIKSHQKRIILLKKNAMVEVC